jgi:hypothetical protein
VGIEVEPAANFDRVAGIRLLCSLGGNVTTNDFVISASPFAGVNTPATPTTIKCRSGQAMRGIRVRSGLELDAITISCGTFSPDFGTLVSYTNDPILGNGQGALVRGFGTTLLSQPIPGNGGFQADFACLNGTQQFISMLQVGFDDDNVNAIQVRCNKILTKPLNTRATQANLTPRTVGQSPFLLSNSSETVTVQVFNLGAAIPFFQALSTYVDLSFSSTQVQFTSVPTNCSFPGTNTIRCPLTIPSSFSFGGVHSFSVTYRLLAPATNSPPFIVQTTYAITESTTSDNTYGFIARPKTLFTLP